MTYKTFAVAGGLGGGAPGSANIGNLIVKHLIEYPDVKVKVLARAGSVNSESAKELESLGVTVVPVDYSKQETLTAAIKDVQVIISAITTTALAVQSALVDAAAAAKKQGSKLELFVPSEFGSDTTDLDESSPLWVKKQLHIQLKELGIPYTLFISGPFADWIAAFTGPDEQGKLTIVGTGDEPVGFTSIDDTARFIAHALATQSPSELQNAEYRIQGSTATFNELSKLYQAKSAKPIEIVHESPEESLKKFAKGDFIAFLKAEWATGHGLVGEPLRNDVWKEWKPKDIREFIQ
ncbi:hypothetical protein QFC22_006133 [Naganishia vaughanmartiniae]|uniref:Uncharacterized protein n=1 Tax=Naganishia vaughanmartiniae TaxID=1424756 RepID=A0ACC2WPQ2_9TREE|nr:hypothetical protein QFC22_006133 [Naganishia vaughanmartiniae]